jgi:hypothetical protein
MGRPTSAGSRCRWVTADQLRPGMCLQSAAATSLQVTAVAKQNRKQQDRPAVWSHNDYDLALGG